MGTCLANGKVNSSTVAFGGAHSQLCCPGSSSGATLCFGFLRKDFGWIVLAEGIRPTRSRAIAFTSFTTSKIFFFLGKQPPHRRRQRLRREGLQQKSHPPRSFGQKNGHVHRIPARAQHA